MKRRLHQDPALETAQAALHEAATQLAFQARILELLNDAVIAVDSSGAVSYWGPGAERLFGVAPADAAGRPARALLRPEWRGRDASAEAAAALASGQLWRGEVVLHGRDGARIEAEVTARSLDEGLPATTFLLVIRDISERRRVELEQATLEASARAAQEERALLDTMLASAPIGFDFLDRDLRFVRVNETLAANNGLPVEAHLGRTVREVLPALADTVEPLLRQVIETGQPILDLEITGETPSQPGVPRIWRESLYPVRGPDGEVLGVGAFVTEITEHRRSSEERRQLLAAEQRAREAAESAVRERDELIALISHDLKNPLTVIQGQAQLLERRIARGDAPDPQRIVRGLGTIAQAAARMSAQIEELLDVAMIRAGRPLRLYLQPTDLVALAQRSVAMAQANTDRHALRLSAAEAELMGSWDSSRVERVVGNLLSNAVKYSPLGGEILVAVARECDAGGRWARISVADRGIGIPAADLPQIFERFHRAANTAGQIKGTGLGLTSAKRIVEQHGGTIAVVSVEGQGSTFTVRLPL